MSKLTIEEKLQINDGILLGKSIESIAKELGRPQISIVKHANTFIQSVSNFNKTGKYSETKESTPYNEPNEHGVIITEESALSTIHKLRIEGIDKSDAEFALSKVHSILTEQIDDSNRLTAMCYQVLGPKATMITRTAGGKSGVAVMTQAAGELMDNKKSIAKEHNRKCLFNPTTKKVT